MSREVAKARQSQLVTTYGVGSLFPAQNQSFMIMGLDSWSDRSPEILEPRLARLLGVSDFRAPAVNDSKGRDLPVIRFPEWHFCPQCRRLDAIWKFTGWNDNMCPDCQAELVPSRFVTCCERGHIDEFPYYRWLHAGDQRAGPHSLRLIARGRSSSLADIQIHCSCGIRPVSLEGAFDAGALRGLYRCKGRRPWLADTQPEECAALPRTLQRGSSNVWFPVTRSAISIPPWSEGAFKVLERHWKVLQAVPLDALEATIEAMGIAGPGIHCPNWWPLSVAHGGSTRWSSGTPRICAPTSTGPCATAGRRPPDSRTSSAMRSRWRPASAAGSRRCHVSRGCARCAHCGPSPACSRPLSTPTHRTTPRSPRDRPHGFLRSRSSAKGIFVLLDPERLAAWESTPFARGRADLVQKSIDDRSRGRGLAERPLVTARVSCSLHTLAHALIDQLSLDAGYPSASLRERLYADGDMAGFLVYTATSDSAGSLGGVAAQSTPDRFEHAVGAAIARMSWCSSDPVCIESTGTGTDALNLAACHSCLLLPETSCELSNTFLDRAALVGLPGVPDGFFSPDPRVTDAVLRSPASPRGTAKRGGAQGAGLAGETARRMDGVALARHRQPPLQALGGSRCRAARAPRTARSRGQGWASASTCWDVGVHRSARTGVAVPRGAVRPGRWRSRAPFAERWWTPRYCLGRRAPATPSFCPTPS